MCRPSTPLPADALASNPEHWAFATPLRKIYYNLTVTGLSVVATLLIGIIELTQVLTQSLGLTAGFWGRVQMLDFGWIGYLLVGLFVLTWSFSYGAWRLLRIEERKVRLPEYR